MVWKLRHYRQLSYRNLFVGNNGKEVQLNFSQQYKKKKKKEKREKKTLKLRKRLREGYMRFNMPVFSNRAKPITDER